jgi:hypothetical protein
MARADDGEPVGDDPTDRRLAAWREAALGSVDGQAQGHPATIVEVAYNGAVRVRWVGRTGAFEGRRFMHQDLLAPVDAAEAERLTSRLRSRTGTGSNPSGERPAAAGKREDTHR